MHRFKEAEVWSKCPVCQDLAVQSGRANVHGAVRGKTKGNPAIWGLCLFLNTHVQVGSLPFERQYWLVFKPFSFLLELVRLFGGGLKRTHFRNRAQVGRSWLLLGWILDLHTMHKGAELAFQRLVTLLTRVNW